MKIGSCQARWSADDDTCLSSPTVAQRLCKLTHLTSQIHNAHKYSTIEQSSMKKVNNCASIKNTFNSQTSGQNSNPYLRAVYFVNPDSNQTSMRGLRWLFSCCTKYTPLFLTWRSQYTHKESKHELPGHCMHQII